LGIGYLLEGPEAVGFKASAGAIANFNLTQRSDFSGNRIIVDHHV